MSETLSILSVVALVFNRTIGSGLFMNRGMSSYLRLRPTPVGLLRRPRNAVMIKSDGVLIYPNYDVPGLALEILGALGFEPILSEIRRSWNSFGWRFLAIGVTMFCVFAQGRETSAKSAGFISSTCIGFLIAGLTAEAISKLGVSLNAEDNNRLDHRLGETAIENHDSVHRISGTFKSLCTALASISRWVIAGLLAFASAPLPKFAKNMWRVPHRSAECYLNYRGNGCIRDNFTPKDMVYIQAGTRTPSQAAIADPGALAGDDGAHNCNISSPLIRLYHKLPRLATASWATCLMA